MSLVVAGLARLEGFVKVQDPTGSVPNPGTARMLQTCQHASCKDAWTDILDLSLTIVVKCLDALSQLADCMLFGRLRSNLSQHHEVPREALGMMGGNREVQNLCGRRQSMSQVREEMRQLTQELWSAS